jgi:hypothetical protein
MNWAQQIPLERLLLIAVAAGYAMNELRRCRSSLREHGQRLGELEKKQARDEGRGADGR